MSLTPHEVEAVRKSLVHANATFTASQLELAVEAVRREHDDPEQHDRTLIQQALARTPRQRLDDMLAMLRFIERARRARPLGPLRPLCCSLPRMFATASELD